MNQQAPEGSVFAIDVARKKVLNIGAFPPTLKSSKHAVLRNRLLYKIGKSFDFYCEGVLTFFVIEKKQDLTLPTFITGHSNGADLGIADKRLTAYPRFSTTAAFEINSFAHHIYRRFEFLPSCSTSGMDIIFASASRQQQTMQRKNTPFI
jgi:hypothetical protein